MGVRTIPIIAAPTIQMSTPSPGEPMDITTPTGSSAPASATKSPDRDLKVNGGTVDRLQPPTPQHEQPSPENSMPAPSAAAPAAHQPKVQTAFIHKLWRYAASPDPPRLLVAKP